MKARRMFEPGVTCATSKWAHRDEERWEQDEAAPIPAPSDLVTLLVSTMRTQLEGTSPPTEQTSAVLRPSLSPPPSRLEDAARIMPPQSLHEHYARRASFSVSELVAPSWCEYAYLYGIMGMRNRPAEQRPEKIVTRTGTEIKPDKQVAERRDKILKEGKVVHSRLEREIYPEKVSIAAKSAEDFWALRLLKLIIGLRTLIDDGCCRELPVFGFVRGHLVFGVIDEIERRPLGAESSISGNGAQKSSQKEMRWASQEAWHRDQARNNGKTKSKASQQPAQKTKLDAFFAPKSSQGKSEASQEISDAPSVGDEEEQPSASQTSQSASTRGIDSQPQRWGCFLSDTKTRVSSTLPHPEVQMQSRLQVMLYKRLFDSLAADPAQVKSLEEWPPPNDPLCMPLDFAVLFATLDLDPDAALSKAFTRDAGPLLQSYSLDFPDILIPGAERSNNSEGEESQDFQPTAGSTYTLSRMVALVREAFEELRRVTDGSGAIQKTLQLVFRRQSNHFKKRVFNRRRVSKRAGKKESGAETSSAESQQLPSTSLPRTTASNEHRPGSVSKNEHWHECKDEDEDGDEQLQLAIALSLAEKDEEDALLSTSIALPSSQEKTPNESMSASNSQNVHTGEMMIDQSEDSRQDSTSSVDAREVMMEQPTVDVNRQDPTGILPDKLHAETDQNLIDEADTASLTDERLSAHQDPRNDEIGEAPTTLKALKHYGTTPTDADEIDATPGRSSPALNVLLDWAETQMPLTLPSSSTSSKRVQPPSPTKRRRSLRISSSSSSKRQRAGSSPLLPSSPPLPQPPPPPPRVRRIPKSRAADRSIIGTVSFPHDSAMLDDHLRDILRVWMGERALRGVREDQVGRCRFCEYVDGCEWLESKAREKRDEAERKRLDRLVEAEMRARGRAREGEEEIAAVYGEVVRPDTVEIIPVPSQLQATRSDEADEDLWSQFDEPGAAFTGDELDW